MRMKTNRVLICSPRAPEYDREGGSRRIFHFIEFFIRAGWQVSVAANDGLHSERYVRTLQQMGVPTYALMRPWSNERDALIDFDRLIDGGGFDVVIIAFWYCAEPYIPRIRARLPSATVIVDSIDIHFLRQSRQVFSVRESNGHPVSLDETYGDQMRREVNAYASADAVLTVSQKEAQLVNDVVGRPVAYAVPDMEDIQVSPIPFEERKGMLFVGNFRHPPNAQAIEYFCEEILPKLPKALVYEHPFYIVGNDPTESVLKCCEASDDVRLVGWAPSVLPYLHHARISVIPLLHGAGTKRKLVQSLMAGAPSVSTTVGIEGLGLTHDVNVLVADDPESFAASIQRLIEDHELWRRLSIQGRDFIMRTHGREAVYAQWSEAFGRVLKQATR
jgi:glycosyltransferase involved in cell wall biosynthesis